MSRLCAVAGFMHVAFREFSEGVQHLERSVKTHGEKTPVRQKQPPGEEKEGFRVTSGSVAQQRKKQVKRREHYLPSTAVLCKGRRGVLCIPATGSRRFRVHQLRGPKL